VEKDFIYYYDEGLGKEEVYYESIKREPKYLLGPILILQILKVFVFFLRKMKLQGRWC
jgi:hypothetical protein